ncbi:MAG: transglutaminase family protein, partial [Woeseia sp.]
MNFKNPTNKSSQLKSANPFSLATAGRIIISSAVLCCVFLTTGIAAPDQYMAPKEHRDRAARIAEQYRELADTIPSELYEIEGLADQLDYELDAAADYVSRNVAFDPYHGIMRGPDGTLSAGAGSAWDQAGLLVSLINTMGGDARVVQGPLTQQEAERLLRLAFEPREPFQTPLEPATVERTFADVLPADALEEARKEDSNASSRANAATFERRIGSVSENILQTMEKQGVPVADSASADELLAALSKSYAWVEYRDSPNEPWKAVHPAFGEQAAPAVKAVAYAKTEAPEEWVHY